MSITPREPADFTPTRGNYTELKPFRFWCQKVLPLVYDDSLSYYELLCKVVDFLNKTMEDVETLEDDVTNIYTAYNELQEYVNTYFSSLDVQEEIDNKLDQMASDGSLTALIEPLLPDLISAWLTEHMTPTTPAIDNTLSVSGAGADAQKTGNAIAPLFSTSSTYAVNDLVLRNGTVYRCKTAVTTPGNWDSTKWVGTNINAEIRRMQRMSFVSADLQIDNNNVSEYNDFNTLDHLKTYGIHLSSGTNIANTPYGSNVPSMYGLLFSASHGNGFLQVYYSYNGESFYRIYHNGSWYNWYKFARGDLAFISAEMQIDNSSVAQYNDFNNLDHLKTYGVHLSAGANIANTPYGNSVPNMFGIVFNASHGNGYLQIYYNHNGDFFYRIYHGGAWLNWSKNLNNTKVAFISGEMQIDNNNVSEYNDFNNLDPLKTYGVHLSSGANIANTPYGSNVPSMYGLLFGASHGNGFLQVYYSYDGEVYYRIRHNGTWWNWYQIRKKSASSDYTNALTNKHWYACGDSFTHGAFEGIDPSIETTFSSGLYAGQNKVYPFFIGNRTGATIHNVASVGMTLGTRTGGVTDNTFGAVYQSSIGSNADYITFYFGINDSGNCPLGTINDNDLTTFYGAWNTIINWCLTNRPNAHLGIFISNSVANQDYVTATRNIAVKWGIPALDMNSTDHLLVVNNTNTDISDAAKTIANNKFRVSSDNHHPNPLCHEMESYFIEQWLCKL